MQQLTLEENEPAERPKSPDELLRGIAKRNDKIRDLGWQIVQEAWLNGQDLIHLKEQLGHGKYLLALKSVGMKPDRAARYMRLARGHQISDCQKFETIATALKALKPGSLAEEKKKALDHYNRVVSLGREQLTALRLAGEALSRIEELGGEEAQSRFLKSNPDIKETAIKGLHICNTIENVEELSADKVLALVA